MVQYGKGNWIFPLLKHLIVTRVAAGVNYLLEKPDLLCKSFLVVGINSNFSCADDDMIWLEIDIEMIFSGEHDDDIFKVSQQKL